MANEKIISDPQLRINNETFQVVPNSIRMVRGKGESEMKPQSVGNGKVEHVYSENVETKIGKIMCSIYVTPDQLNTVVELKTNQNTNYISISDGTTQMVMAKAALVNDPEHAFSNDGQVELEFHGSEVR